MVCRDKCFIRGNLGTKHVQETVFQGCSHPDYFAFVY